MKYWKAKTGDDVTVKASRWLLDEQARSVIDGLDADVGLPWRWPRVTPSPKGPAGQ